ncbi:MAG: 3-deoxy-manno-octulosonate cytidylyltransferase, partial [Elusimicrobiota bacterium]|nr:3-deoxy-manno-octulosonate cytidylyltransferase [Elusimicrobiota bacterium]
MSSGSKVLTVIPARISSTRLKEKPLADLGGKPLIYRVWKNVVSNPAAGRVVVAADSKKIKKTVENFGGKCVMTPESLNSGSDRVYYTAREYYP